MAFILDPTSLNEIVGLYLTHGMQVLEIVFSMCRTYAYGLHRKKLILVGKWPYATRDENCSNFNYQINSTNVEGTMTRTSIRNYRKHMGGAEEMKTREARGTRRTGKE